MATLWSALVTAVLLAFGYSGLATRADLGTHVRAGLLSSIFAALVQSIPFAYFLGTGFWLRAFARASQAGTVWEERHRAWMKGRAYPAMYLAPLLTMAAAISGGLAQTGRLAAGWHLLFVVAAVLAALAALLLVPPVMRRNAALMDELAERHVLRPPEVIRAEEARTMLPPLFQLSRVLMYAGVQLLIIWLYLRFGTEGWRNAPFLPFGAGFCVLLTAGLGLNARYDPQRPHPPGRAWGRAAVIGGILLAGVAVLSS